MPAARCKGEERGAGADEMREQQSGHLGTIQTRANAAHNCNQCQCWRPWQSYPADCLHSQPGVRRGVGAARNGGQMKTEPQKKIPLPTVAGRKVAQFQESSIELLILCKDEPCPALGAPFPYSLALLCLQCRLLCFKISAFGHLPKLISILLSGRGPSFSFTWLALAFCQATSSLMHATMLLLLLLLLSLLLLLLSPLTEISAMRST